MPLTGGRNPHLHWQEKGSGSPLLLVMGHRFSGRMWGSLVDLLAAEHRVVWFDNRGTGRSGATRDATVRDLTDDALTVMDAAQLAEAHVFGVSMGGVVALDLALAAPERVRSLVIGCSGVLTADKPRAPRSRYVAYYLPTWLTLRLSAPALYGPACPPDRRDADLALLRDDVFDRRGVIAQAKAVAAHATTLEEVATIAAPTLVLHGTADRVVPLAWGEELARTVPGAQLVRYEDSGHSFLAERPEEVSADVLRFLASVGS